MTALGKPALLNRGPLLLIEQRQELQISLNKTIMSLTPLSRLKYDNELMTSGRHEMQIGILEFCVSWQVSLGYFDIVHLI